MRSRTVSRSMGAVFVLATLLVGGFTVPASGTPTPNRELQQTKGFRKAVTVDGIREHQQRSRPSPTPTAGPACRVAPGFDASAEYVADAMDAAGYEVERQVFGFIFWEELEIPVLEQTAPNPTTYTWIDDFYTMEDSASGDVTAPVQAVDLMLPPGPAANTSTSGCEESDSAGFTAGSIALMQRGTCAFGLKAQNAADAGAVGAIIFNEGQPGRTGVIAGTLGGPVPIPVTGMTFALGEQLAAVSGLTMHMVISTFSEARTTENVIAETPGGDPDHTIVIGAHLDSVPAGPGINDNGSGSGMLLEIAETFAAQGREPRNKLRFIWFGAEEAGLVGSEYYVGNLTDEEYFGIQLMLNFDMVGSPNYVRFVYDGDNSAGGGSVGPEGSAAIEDMFSSYFEALFGDENFSGSSPTPFNGRSDYGPFIAVGIPAGGLFTGAGEIKTAEEAALYGGTAGVAYDPCYHQACDTFANVSLDGLDEMSDAAAHVILLVSKRNFDLNPLVDPLAAVGGQSTGRGGGGSSERASE